jgi:hypothetical protein
VAIGFDVVGAEVVLKDVVGNDAIVISSLQIALVVVLLLLLLVRTVGNSTMRCGSAHGHRQVLFDFKKIKFCRDVVIF